MAEKPYSRQARNALDEIIVNRIQVLFPPSISDEWKKHASGYAIRWRAMMTSRGLAKNVKDKKSILLRKTIRMALPDVSDTQALLKDVHLLEAAVAYACGILSSDNRSGRLAGVVSEHFDALKRVQWVSPHFDPDGCCHWLKSRLVDIDYCCVGQSSSRSLPKQSDGHGKQSLPRGSSDLAAACD
ncbi:hypothetical protein [Micromonospora carbonacea]|uniref:hypothetical protein n=1 Tax=Micromonospora carbonacea TaxID=47853 RepID=UPI00371645C8